MTRDRLAAAAAAVFSITVRGRRQRAEKDPPAGVSLVSVGVHPVTVRPATLGRYGLRFVQVPAGQRGPNQIFGFRLYVRFDAGPEGLAPFLCVGVAPPAEH